MPLTHTNALFVLIFRLKMHVLKRKMSQHFLPTRPKLEHQITVVSLRMLILRDLTIRRHHHLAVQHPVRQSAEFVKMVMKRVGMILWPLTLKFDRATWSFVKFDR